MLLTWLRSLKVSSRNIRKLTAVLKVSGCNLSSVSLTTVNLHIPLCAQLRDSY